MQASYEQTSFMSGEWSLSMQGRTEHSEYRRAMNVCLNGLPIETEAWTRRPGVITSGATRQGKPGRVYKFDLAEAQPYNMEFTDGFLRLWSGFSRVTGNDPQNIASVSNASPAVIGTAAVHGWSTGQTVFFTGLAGVAPMLQGRAFIITVTDTTHFSIVDELTGAAINGSLLNWIGGGQVQRILEIPTPFVNGSWQPLRSVQAEEQAILLNGTVPQVLTAITSPGPNAFASFTLAPVNFQDGPYLDPFPGSVASPSGTQGNITVTLSFQLWASTFSYSLGDYVSSGGINYKSLQGANLNNNPGGSPTFWKVVSGGDPIGPGIGFQNSDIGRHIRLFAEPPLWVSTTAYTTGQVVSFSTVDGAEVFFQALANNTGVTPGTDATKWVVVAGQAFAAWTWGRILSVSGAGIISGSLSGSVNIGNMTGGGGLAAAFDGTTSQPFASSAQGAASTGDVYVGKNYTGAVGGPQQIGQVVVYPTSNDGFLDPQSNNFPSFTVTLNLRAKQSAPGAPNDGTLLGTSGAISNTFSPVTIISNDQVTNWAYVWVELIINSGGGGGSTYQLCISQVVFFTPNVSNGSVATVQIAGAPLINTNPCRLWRLGLYSGSIGWPTNGTFHEGRLWLSGAVPNRIDASTVDSIFLFSPTEPDGTVDDSNGISAIFNATDVNALFWMIGKQEGIACGTQAGEWLIQATTINSPLSPLNIQAHRYTTIKCANIEPAICEHTLVFCQKHKRRIMEYFADIFSGKFTAPNITYKSQHITQPGLVEIRYQHDAMPVVWVRTADNLLSGITYKRDSLMSRDGPTICAHHRHQLGTNRTVESMTVGPTGVTGDLESLSLVTTDGTYRYVEIMAQPFGEKDPVTSAQFLDGIIPSSYVVGSNGVIFNGLWLLNGQTVSVFAGGLDCGQAVVANGSVTVGYGDGIAAGPGLGLFTQAFVNGFNGAMPSLAGLPYLSQGQTTRPNHPQESGTRQGPAFGKVRRSHRVVAQVVNAVSGYLNFGTTFTALMPAFFRKANGPIIRTLFSGIYKETLQDKGDPLDSMLTWQASGPFPCTVAKIGAFLNTEDE